MSDKVDRISPIFIVGQTAAGKTKLSLDLGKLLPIEIVAADSKTIWRQLDVGTAKPGRDQQRLVKHHLIDVVGPDDKFTVFDFQRRANQALDVIRTNNRRPVIVGGSGLYIDSLFYDYKFVESQTSQEVRDQLEQKTIENLQQMIVEESLPRPENWQNKRYLIRTIERRSKTIPRDCQPSIKDKLIVGLKLPKEVLEDRISRRFQEMIDNGVVAEARKAWTIYPENHEALTGNIYQSLIPYLNQEVGLEDVRQDFINRDLKLAKKQITWFKRNKQIVWFDNNVEALDYLKTQI